MSHHSQNWIKIQNAEQSVNQRDKCQDFCENEKGYKITAN